jgi:3-dehydroquinate synthase
MGLARDPLLFDILETAAPKLVASGFATPRVHGLEVLRMAIAAMLEELGRNPYEDKGYERVVDFGHTFSPALEAAMDFNIHHGEAVAVDMALSAAIARCLGLIHRDIFDRIVTLLRSASLPIYTPELDVGLCLEGLQECRRHRGGSINLVVPAGIGRTVFLKRAEDVPKSILVEALQILRRHALGDS